MSLCKIFKANLPQFGGPHSFLRTEIYVCTLNLTLIEAGGGESRHPLGDWLPFLAGATRGPKNS